MSKLKLILGAVFAFVILFLGYAKYDWETRGKFAGSPEVIAQECERTYGRLDEYRVNDCKIKMLLRVIGDREQEKLDSTYDRVRR